MQVKNPLVVDVAYNNISINWKVAKAGGVRAGIAKASESFTIEDSQFKNNWQQMYDAQVPRGAYHFYRWWASSGSQAKKFASVINKYGGVKPGDRLFLDDEEQGHMSLRSMIDFSYNVYELLGIYSIWYSWAWMLNQLKMNKLKSSDIEFLAKTLIWSAGYPNNPDLFTYPPKFYIPDQTKFGPVVLWQYDSEVPGIQGIPGGTDVNWVDPDFLAAWENESGHDVVVHSDPTGSNSQPQAGSFLGVASAQPYLRVRQGPGVGYPISSGDVVMPGQTVQVLEVSHDLMGNMWGRIGDNRWIAIQYGGQVYVHSK